MVGPALLVVIEELYAVRAPSQAERIRPFSLKDRIWFALKVLIERRHD